MSQFDSLCATILARPAEVWTTDTMADRVHYSRYHFVRSFRAEVGITPGRFVTQVRLEAARRLLVSGPPMTVAELCRRVGYNSPGSFTTMFHARFGLPPALYRREHAISPERTPA
jgi:AraC-like DNA-binding protein